jgi:hypothetical protein
MPSDVFEEPLELEIDLLEACPPTVASYPYPALRTSGPKQKGSFRGVTLENPFLRATFLPALGGRLISLIDKRTGIEVFDVKLDVVNGGKRGVTVPHGLQLHLDGYERLTSLAAVQYAAEEADEERPAGLWMAEAVTGTGMSWHLHVTLAAHRAEVRVEARVFNRGFEDVDYQAGLLLPPGSQAQAGDGFLLSGSGGYGVAIIPDTGAWSAFEDEGVLFYSRFRTPRSIAPRQLDTWTVSIIPFSGLAEPRSASRSGVLSIKEDLLQLQAAVELQQHKLVILTDAGQTLEAPITALPGKTSELKLPGPVSAAALMDSARTVVLELQNDRPTTAIPPRLEWSRQPFSAAGAKDINGETFDVATRHFAYARLGMQALARGDFEAADRCLEQSLLYNGEDHLSWWMKAMASRLMEETGDTPELLNAHYLAPLEPALRAESFLGRRVSMEKDPDPLLKSFDEYPETFVEVATLLLDAGLYEQASRWIDESLRHVDLAMLRYLLAFAHLKATHLAVDASEHIIAAGKLPFGPPYPWRPIEIEAMVVLSDHFPQDSRLQEYATLMALRRTS